MRLIKYTLFNLFLVFLLIGCNNAKDRVNDTVIGKYVSGEIIYKSPISSMSSSCIQNIKYTIENNRLIITEKEGKEIVYSNIFYEKEQIKDEYVIEDDIAREVLRDTFFSKYKKREYYVIYDNNEKLEYSLFNMDEKLFLCMMKAGGSGNTWVWHIVELIHE